MDVSKRIEFIVDSLDKVGCLADIGTDHGYVPLLALEREKADKVIACDINKDPLDKAKLNAILEGIVGDEIDFRLGSGLKPLEIKEANSVVIAGMGGLLISNIILNDYEKVIKFKKIIIDAHSEIEKLRANLISKYFVFDNEILIQDGKHNYVIIEGHFDLSKRMKYDLLDMKFGPVLRQNQPPLFKEIIRTKKKHFTECLKKATDETSKSKLKIELAYIQMLEGTNK